MRGIPVERDLRSYRRVLSRIEAAGFRIASLGPRTLRAETAAIVAVALVGYAVAQLPVA
jgi:hypothetical protein